MNYKKNALRELDKLTQEFPDYTLGEVLYSVLRLTKITDISGLKKLSDEDIFSAAEKATDEEKDN